jgi:hypothetical protein
LISLPALTPVLPEKELTYDAPYRLIHKQLHHSIIHLELHAKTVVEIDHFMADFAQQKA